ncbi:hypothetical protein RRG08_047855 [Elysia crispata]|uniref:Uncharacterized protein n=1 Tax=Elysia crispata TaxID=231223 RepID=A0AAE0ZXF1_9GAST|nr:hypothetical protein RRG08_047855 [Elysia crispata]
MRCTLHADKFVSRKVRPFLKIIVTTIKMNIGRSIVASSRVCPLNLEISLKFARQTHTFPEDARLLLTVMDFIRPVLLMCIFDSLGESQKIGAVRTQYGDPGLACRANVLDRLRGYERN